MAKEKGKARWGMAFYVLDISTQRRHRDRGELITQEFGTKMKVCAKAGSSQSGRDARARPERSDEI